MRDNPYEYLRLSLGAAKEAYKWQGFGVQISGMDEMYGQARELIGKVRSKQTVELWLSAKLLYVLKLVTEPMDWEQFLEEINLTPYGYSDEPVPETQCGRALHALLLTNLAIASCFYREKDALIQGKEAAVRALLYYQQLHSLAFCRWQATTLLVLARWASYVKQETQQRNYAQKAADLLVAVAPSSELCVYAQYLAGQSDGLVKAGLFRKRRAFFSEADYFCFQV